MSFGTQICINPIKKNGEGPNFGGCIGIAKVVTAGKEKDIILGKSKRDGAQTSQICKTVG